MKKLTIILVFLVAILGCQRDEFENNTTNLPTGIEWAKTWFETNYPVKLSLKSGSGSGDNKNLNPDWKSAIKSGNEKYEAVTLNLLTEREFGFTTQDSKKAWIESGEIKYIQSVSRLVILKEKTTQKTISFIMTTIGDKQYLENKKFKLQENNNYLKKDYDFSGIVLYHGMDGSFVNGWKFTEGKVSHIVNLPTDSNLRKQLKLARICTTEDITEWEMVPKYSLAGVYGSEIIKDIYGYEIYAHTYTITTCYDTESDGGTTVGGEPSPSGSTTEPDVPGGYLPPRPPLESPCNCTNTCPDCGGCLDVALLKSANADCPACSCPKVIVTDESFVNTKAECVYTKLKKSSLLNNLQSDFKLSEKYNLTYTVVDFLTPINSTDQPNGAQIYNDQLNTSYISINSYYFDKVVPVTIANTILHETIHASIAQNIDRAGGLSGLDANDFEELIVYYYKNSINSGLADHSIISQWYVPLMANTLAKFDNYKLDSSKYTALAWHGLQDTYLWNIKTRAEQANIRAIWEEINTGIKDCKL